MNSVERLTHYVDTIEAEPFDAPAAGRAPAPSPLPPSWPAKGALEFRDYRMSYRAGTPEVLHGVSFAVRGGEKVGIVGRTGSGKSSLMVSLFRLIEDRCHSGQILLDGVDVDGVGVSALRRELAIIPQEPVLFSGSMRSNLDPAGQATGGDAQLWAALDRVGLKAVVERLKGGLDAPVAEFGENLSAGQKQLVCLARVLLRKCRIVLLDEATSSVDFATDQLMQRTIKDCFEGATILTIAHRLNTVIDCDRILVMDAGVVAESGSPHELLGRAGGVFAGLVRELGPSSAAALIARAAENAARKGGAEAAAGSLMLRKVEGVAMAEEPAATVAGVAADEPQQPL
jgi:ABC-type multidrug transport system fused ATPase/permease subunit